MSLSLSSPSPSPVPPPPSSSSPPHTPPAADARSSSTPQSDDSSVIEDLSFDYIFDPEGNYVRFSKGSSSKSNTSSPPTPQDSLPDKSPPEPRRVSLSRSESVRLPATQTQAPADRNFHRVASGPIPTTSKSRTPAARRVTMEDSVSSNKVRTVPASTRPSYQHEKENYITSDSESAHEQSKSAVPSARVAPLRTTYARSHLTDARQILPGPNRAGRIMKSASSATPASSKYGLGFDKISESKPDEAMNAYISETDPEDDLPPPPSSTPFPSSNGGDTELIEQLPQPSSIPSTSSLATTSKQRSYVQLPVSAHEPTPLEAPLTKSTGTRPRRSASLSDALSLHGHQHQQQNHQQLREQYLNMRPGPTASDSTGGPRRVTVDEREREEHELRAEYKRYRREAGEGERLQADQEQHYDRQYLVQSSHASQPPQLVIQPSLRTTTPYGHKRRDSDTLRSMPSSATAASPTMLSHPQSRPSDPVRHRHSGGSASPPGTAIRVGRVSPPVARIGRTSPPYARGERLSPPPLNSRTVSSNSGASSGAGRISPPARVSPPAVRTAGRASPPAPLQAGHRRSPTAPEMGMGADEYAVGVMEGRRLQQQQQQQEQLQQEQQQQEQQQYMQPAPVASRSAPQPAAIPGVNRHLFVNKKPYARLDMIGKGGSSRVYRVLSSTNDLYAIKRVALDKTDAETMNGYMNEISLLKRLEGNSRIIRLIDSELKPGPGGSKGYLMLVMECGEVDLARLIAERVGEGLDMVWVAYYWQQMLQAVHVIHEEKIVHSDLKPANFVLVRGQLKLIDFGIANAIANDTTNIQRDHPIGTVNYMSPEAIEHPDGLRRFKVGRPSDVWSLGCILYQMVYGHPPFQHLSVYQKMKAIPDLGYIIEFPEYSIPIAPAPRTSAGGSGGAVTPPKRLEHLKKRVRNDVVESMKSCLCRGPKERATIPELLEQDWLAMKEPELPAVKHLLAPDETVINPYYMRQLLQYGIKLGGSPSSDMSPEALLREAERLVAELKSIQP